MRFSELDGARVGVWGAGREISSFAEQLARRMPCRANRGRRPSTAPPAADVRAQLGLPAGGRRWSDAEVAARWPAATSSCARPGSRVHRAELRALRAARRCPVTTATALWLAEHGGERRDRRHGHEGQEHDRGARLPSRARRRAERARSPATSACPRSICSTRARADAGRARALQLPDRRPRARARGGADHEPLPRAHRLARLGGQPTARTSCGCSACPACGSRCSTRASELVAPSCRRRAGAHALRRAGGLGRRAGWDRAARRAARARAPSCRCRASTTRSTCAPRSPRSKRSASSAAAAGGAARLRSRSRTACRTVGERDGVLVGRRQHLDHARVGARGARELPRAARWS